MVPHLLIPTALFLLSIFLQNGVPAGAAVHPRPRTPTHRRPAPPDAAHERTLPEPVRQVTPAPGLQISSSARLRPGTYHLPGDAAGAIQVTGHDIVLDCRGVKLLGGGKGIGLHLVDAQNVTLRGLTVSDYLWGVVVEKGSWVYLDTCVSSHNNDLPIGTVIDESGKEPQDTHGGGFLFRDCRHCRAVSCAAQHEWDGLDLVRCENNTFRDSDFSYLNNWGVHLWGSSHNTIVHNRCIWCTTGEGKTYQGISGWQTYDAEAICIEHSSSYNLVQENDLRYGGDGIFIRANEGAAVPGVPVPPLNPSNHNVIFHNDCSFSPNNAIEADFCDDNQFLQNNCSFSNYGFWLGYSRRAVVKGNTVVGCTSQAIQIENGQDDKILDNTFINGGKADQSLVFLYQNGRDKTPSGPYQVRNNVFVGSSQPVKLARTMVEAGGNRLVTSSSQIFFPDKDSSVTFTGATAAPGSTGPEITKITPNPLILGGSDKELISASSNIPSTAAVRILAFSPPPIYLSSYAHPGYAPAESASWPAETPRRLAATTPPTGPEEKTPPTVPFALPAYNNLVVISGARLTIGTVEPVVEIDGIPAMLVSHTPTRLVVAVPSDFWNRPVLAAVPVKVFNGEGYTSPAALKLAWHSDRPRLEAITPGLVAPGISTTLVGDHLQGPNGTLPTIYLDGVPAHVLGSTPNSVTFAAPSGLLTTHHYNLVVKAVGESNPLLFSVTVPGEWDPHIISARFTPQTLHAGQLLHFTATIKNNAPFALPSSEPGSGHTYGEKESFGSQKISEKPGSLYIRVTSDLVGGSWPYLFGLPDPLPPGETASIEGNIRVETPGTTKYRIGLVDGRTRWIDDNLYPTSIQVLPPDRS